MSASRLGKLKSIIDELMSLLQDVDPAVVEELLADSKEAGGGGGSKNPKKPKKGEDKKPFTKNDEAALAKAAADATKVGELTKQVETLTAQVKAKDAEVARLSKSVAMPNSMVVEQAPSAQSTGPVAPVGWPSDMNNPMSKETIKKEHWFETE